MKNLLIAILFPFTILTQNENTFRIEFNTDFRGYEMGELNDRINDPQYIDTNFYDELDNISISEGFSFGLSLTYQPFKFINLGVYGGFQFGDVVREIRIIQNLYEPFIPNDTTFGKRHFELKSGHVGVTSDLIFNQMDFWLEKTSLSRLELAWNLCVGYGSSFLFTYDRFEDFVPNNNKIVYKSNGLQVTSGVKIGYILSSNNYISSIGLKVGYQYYKTNNLRAEGGSFYPFGNRTELDFSGFTVGAYFSLGR